MIYILPANLSKSRLTWMNKYITNGDFRNIIKYLQFNMNWMPPSLSELTPIISDMELTHLTSEASN